MSELEGQPSELGVRCSLDHSRAEGEIIGRSTNSGLSGCAALTTLARLGVGRGDEPMVHVQ